MASIRRVINFTVFIYILVVKFCFTNGQIAKPYDYTSYQTEVVCTPSFPTEYPSTIEEVQKIVQTAIGSNTTVKAIGSLHSVLDTICTEGIPMDVHNINYIKIDPSTQEVTAGAGTEVADFFEFLESNWRALDGHTPSFGGVTIGGALGTGARGSSLLHRTSFSDQIIALTIIDGSGNIQVLNEDHPDFNGFRVHLGLLGIIIDATFKTIPAYKMLIENYPASDSILSDGTFLAMALEFDWLELWWFPSSSSVVVSKGRNMPFDTPGNASTYNIPDLDKVTTFLLRTALEEGQAFGNQIALGTIEAWSALSLYAQVPLKQPVFSQDGGVTIKNPAVGYVHNLMQNRCTKCGWQYGPGDSIYQSETAFGIDLIKFNNTIQTIRDILRISPASFPIYGIFIRFAPASRGMMSVEYGRETFHVEIVTPMRVNRFTTARASLAAVEAMEQSIVFNLGGRPHWSMCGQALHTKEMMERSAPNLKGFRTLVTKYDPNGLFMNNFGKRLMGVENTLTIDTRTVHCALEENCFCAKNTDCATGQVCTELNGFNVCKDILPEIGIITGLPANVLRFVGSLII